MDPSATRLPFVNAVCRFASVPIVAVLVAVGCLLRWTPVAALAQQPPPAAPHPPPTTYHLPSATDHLPSQTPWYEGFEGPEASWRLVGGNGAYQVEAHQRVRGSAHTGEGSEYIRVAGSSGTEVFFSHEIGHPRVIDELLPTVWVKADRPGMQLVVQVVLPRTLDPKTQVPVSMLLQGTTYTAVGRWEQLRVEDIPRLLARKAATLRSRWPRLDIEEAYVERVLLNVYGGPGATNVWIDDLDIAGYAGPPTAKLEAAVSVPVPDWWPASQPTSPGFRGSTTPADATGAAPGATNSAAGDPRAAPPSRGRISMSGLVLTIDGRVTFPRIIQYQGEPLSVLASLGFNAVWLPQPATPELLQEARTRGMWLISPPPQGALRDTAAVTEPTPPEIGPEFDPVLAWDLGGGARRRATPVGPPPGRTTPHRRPEAGRPPDRLPSRRRALGLQPLRARAPGRAVRRGDEPGVGPIRRVAPRAAAAGDPRRVSVDEHPDAAGRGTARSVGRWAGSMPPRPSPASRSGWRSMPRSAPGPGGCSSSHTLR